jgi:hypothetical protein
MINFKQFSKKKGFIFINTILFIAVLLILVMAWISLTSTNMDIFNSRKHFYQAKDLAYIALDKSEFFLSTDPDWDDHTGILYDEDFMGGHMTATLNVYNNSFRPTDVTGLKFWVDADDINSIVLNGNYVSQWQDKSGNSHHASQSTVGFQPYYVTNTLNKKSVLHFNGVSQYLQLDAGSVTDLNPTEYTIFCVNIVSGKQGAWRSPFTSRTNSPEGGYLFYAATNNKWQHWVGASGEWSAIGSNNEVILNNPVVLTGIYGDGKQSFYVDGRLDGELTVPFSVNSIYPARIGAGATEDSSPTYYFNGDIAEIAIYNRKLSNIERVQVENYLLNKWMRNSATLSLTGTYKSKVFNFQKTIDRVAKVFKPAHLDDIAMWLDANDVSGNGTSVPNGTPVQTWVDKSGNGNHATQESSLRQPVFLAEALNTKPVINFDGVNDFLVADGVAPVSRLPYTAFVVMIPTPNTVAQQAFIAFHYNYSSQDLYFVNYGGYLTHYRAGHVKLLNENVADQAFILSLNRQTGSIIPFVDGIQKNTRTAGIFIDSNQFSIGQDWDGPTPTDFYRGDFAEIIFYSRILTSEERKQVEGYLSAKWFLQ